jgi:alkaline phosphatase
MGFLDDDERRDGKIWRGRMHGKLFRLMIITAAAACAAGEAAAQTIYPLNRAEILSGSRFDFKVEFPGSPPAANISVTINGRPAADVFGAPAKVIENEDGKPITAYWLRGVSLNDAGNYRIEAEAAGAKSSVTWSVFATPEGRKAKNVILFIGDGMSMAHRTAARILSKGIAEGHYGGELAIDDMPHMALISTAGTDSVVTDSANSMSAYTTGHKSCVGALAVYCSSNISNFQQPNVETITEFLKRKTKLAVGVVTNTEIEDATPAAMVAHTRSRKDYDAIVRMFFDVKPDVILGGGLPAFLPKPAVSKSNGPTRNDNQDYLAKFKDDGYAYAATNNELLSVAGKPETRRLLGLFNTDNIDGALDRKFLKAGSVSKFPDQPDLTDEVKAALDVLSRNDDGFMLMVESGRIDKYTHSLDWERAVYDTIMLDNAVKLAKYFAAQHDDTLIIVVADHGHPISLIGTVDDTSNQPLLRNRTKVYGDAGFPNYPAPGPEGYPASVDVTRRLALGFAAYPDTCDTGKPHLEGENKPRAASRADCVPPESFRPGNLPEAEEKGVHSGDDVVLTAMGPGSEQFHGHMENTRVFRAIATALGLGQ